MVEGDFWGKAMFGIERGGISSMLDVTTDAW